MGRRGFSLIEILTVIIMIGLVAAMAIPKFGTTLSRQNVRGARLLITTMHAKARNAAVFRGRQTALVLKNGRLVIVSRHPVTGAVDTVGRTESDIVGLYGVSFVVNPSGRDTLFFNAGGLGSETGQTTIFVAKAGYADTIAISPLGRILH
jgi:prepilin-type N-terminal cleavage/methylation domain-containing protein